MLLNLNLKKRESPEGGGAVVGVETVGVVALPDSGAVVELRGGDSSEPFLASLSSKLGRPDCCIGVLRPDAEGWDVSRADRRQPTSLEDEFRRSASSSISLLAMESCRLDWARVREVSRSAEVW